ncbi:TPA: ROK family protein, partial [Escherichia coli]
MVVGDALKRFHLVGPSWGAAKNKLAGYSTKYIFELARQGYKEAEFLTERSASTIAELIVSLKLLLDCQVVVVGGS